MAKVTRTLWQSALELQGFLDQLHARFCYIGGIAVQRWGEPRMTRDLDLTVFTGFGHEQPIIDALLLRFQSRIADARQFAKQARILLLQDISGTPIDLSLGGLPFEEAMLDRATLWGTPAKGKIRTCSAEDLILLKAIAGRPQDWLDIDKVVLRQGPQLDCPLILSELAPLAELKEDPDLVANVAARLPTAESP